MQTHTGFWFYCKSGLACRRIVAAFGIAAFPAAALAQEAAEIGEADTEKVEVRGDEEPNREPIIVYGRALDQIGVARAASQGTVGYADFDNVPISRTGELVENVPGVIATQHSGSGKANQYFLRGFNLDHGTDFAGFVDGVPINMRTHGHGQGYLDFNFLIPEALERIDFRKGPYFADVGDFTAAGTVAFTTARTLQPFAQVQLGEFGFVRGVAGGSTPVGSGDLLIVGEAQTYDGPWELPEDLERFTGLIKYSSGAGKNRFSVQLNAYDSTWTSTDQVPERAVESGLISRFGNIDDTLGGSTTRLGGVINASIGETSFNAFATYYDFRLVSNFTYFLEDPVNGDQFTQLDERWVLGGNIAHRFDLGFVDLAVGGDIRHDAISQVGLLRSVDGIPTDPVRLDEVDQTGLGLFGDASFEIAEGLRGFAGLRYDHISFEVRSDLPVNSGNGDDGLFSPKAGLAWTPLAGLEFYANYGQSFHSNDVRGATIRVDPVDGSPADRVPVFARAEGAELGMRVERDAFNATLTGFWLELDSELVFVGDGGATEPNDGSRRYGVEANLFWQPARWIVLDAAFAYTDARFIGPPADLAEIPGAVPIVVSGGVTLRPTETATLTAQVRHFGSAPLIEDGSVTSDPTTLVNLGAYLDIARLTVGAELFNVFDARDADITYFYESRLPGEASGVEDRHFHPVEPRQIRMSIRLRI